MKQTEIEVKFTQVDHDEVRKNLRNLSANLEQPMRLMRRVTIDSDFMRTGKDSFVRVRDEGNRVTLTYKQFDELSLTGAKEIETIVGDYDATVAIFTEAGLAPKSMQESKRETWRLGDVEIVLDEWPWLKPYIEIEGQSEAIVRNTAKQLGFDWSDAVFGDVMAVYRQEYPHLGLKDTVASCEKVRFNDPVPLMLQDTKKPE